MGRLIILLILVVAAIWLLRRFPLAAKPRRQPPPERTLDTIRCARCGVYLPQQDAVKALGHYYCNNHAPQQ